MGLLMGTSYGRFDILDSTDRRRRMARQRKTAPARATKEAEEKFLVRLPSATMRMLRELAKVHGGRTVTQEVRLALELYVAEAMVDAFDDPEFIEMLEAAYPDFDEVAVKTQAEADAARLRDLVLDKPTAARVIARALENR
jgi:hypothetical protein